MDPISLALGLSQFVPVIAKWITGSDKAADVAGKVIDVAKAVTGTSDGQAALASIQADPNKVLEFQQAIAAQQIDIEKAYLLDVQSARDRDVKIVQSGQKNYRADFMFFLAIAMISGLVWLVWKDPNINEYMKGIATLVLGRFLGYLDTIYNFEFGTTRSNKAKDETIKNLSQG